MLGAGFAVLFAGPVEVVDVVGEAVRVGAAVGGKPLLHLRAEAADADLFARGGGVQAVLQGEFGHVCLRFVAFFAGKVDVQGLEVPALVVVGEGGAVQFELSAPFVGVAGEGAVHGEARAVEGEVLRAVGVGQEVGVRCEQAAGQRRNHRGQLA